MKLTLPFLAHCKETRWLLSVTYQHNRYCVIGTLNRLNAIEHQLQKGSVVALLRWSHTLERLKRFRESYQDQSNQLKRLISKRIQCSVTLSAYGNDPITLPISSRLGFAFFEVLQAYDQLMSLLEAAYTFGLLQNRTLQHRKQRSHSSRLLTWMQHVSRWSLVDKPLNQLTTEECQQVQVALQHEQLPFIDPVFFRTLNQLIKGVITE